MEMATVSRTTINKPTKTVNPPRGPAVMPAVIG
jgi:hypothetical protein